MMSDASGLYYMRARFYSPEIRRFVNQDVLLGRVVEGQTLNRYAFVTGRPISYIDPFGLTAVGATLRGIGIIITQVDSPAPGPADIVGLGFIAIGIAIDIIYLSENDGAGAGRHAGELEKDVSLEECTYPKNTCTVIAGRKASFMFPGLTGWNDCIYQCTTFKGAKMPRLIPAERGCPSPVPCAPGLPYDMKPLPRKVGEPYSPDVMWCHFRW